MNVVFHYDAGSALRRRLTSLVDEGLNVRSCDEADDVGFARLMADANVLWHVLRPVTATDIEAAPRLRLIQKIGVGVNTIDLDAARGHGVAVCNMPGTNSRAVAEMALLLMLAALRRLAHVDDAIRTGGGWRLDADLQDSYGEIGGRTVGLVGYGDIPRVLAPILEAMGARVLYTARSAKDDAVGAWRELDALLAEADIVSLHVPLTDATEGMIDEAAFGRMKPGAVLVNTARGGLVDEAALVDALRGGKLRGAGLDVFGEEPVTPDNPLLSLPNVVLAPHIAWLTPETIDRSLTIAVGNCRRLREGRDLLHRVV